MQTSFTAEQLKDPLTARSNAILRSCVHCGFCTATCPTYVLLGDELDSPRGRIYLIKDMLENQRVPDAKTVKHIDRCLSCLSCMTTCPSGVNYMHLVDHARGYIERNYRRPWHERALRGVLARVLPYPGRFRLALAAARVARPFRRLMPDRRLRAMLDMAPARIVPPQRAERPGTHPAQGPRRRRVGLLLGCAQRALNPDIHAATIRILTRHGCEVVIVPDQGCCGALPHHMGKDKQAHALAAANIRAFHAEMAAGGLDSIVINTSGCGTLVKDYGEMFAGSELEGPAREVASRARDVTEILSDLGLQPVAHQGAGLRIAYHAACSLQHGQQIRATPKDLLRAAGFEVVEPRDSHLCCGSAGTYNLLQPELSQQLGSRKQQTLAELSPDVICAGNIGCMVQIGQGMDVPVVHTVEMLDWATGGPVPPALAGGAPASAVAATGLGGAGEPPRLRP